MDRIPNLCDLGTAMFKGRHVNGYRNMHTKSCTGDRMQMKYVAALTALVIVLLSGCISIGEKPLFEVNGNGQVIASTVVKFEIRDTGAADPNSTVEYVTDWGDGRKSTSKRGPVTATRPIWHLWFSKGNYTVVTTGMYDGGKNYTVSRVVEVT